jgi:hypothetical protein
MTVKQLIELLKNENPDAIVWIECEDDYHNGEVDLFKANHDGTIVDLGTTQTSNL